MLGILKQKNLMNVLIIITRYFGGILLGTGGLVRAYSQSTIKAIEMADFVIEEKGYELEIIIDYKELEILKYYCEKRRINIQKIEYYDKIKCILEVNKEEKNKIINNFDKNEVKLLGYKIIKEKNIRKSIEI